MEQVVHRGGKAVTTNLTPLQPYLDDPNVIEIRINRYHEIVLETRQGRVIQPCDHITEFYVEKLLNSLLAFNALSRQPINNVLLPDGSRAVFCMPPAALKGTVLVAIRKHLPISISLEELKEQGRFDATSTVKLGGESDLQDFEKSLLDLHERGDYVEFLRQAVRSKRNIAIAGATGSGKSTFTRSLINEIPHTERLLVLEDVHEPVAGDVQDEIGYMMYGQKGQSGRITPSDGIKACMRLSPDRIILTELRDDAAWDYLTASNTGHSGSIFSVHASSAAETPSRIAQLVKASGVGCMLDYDLIMQTIHTTLDVIVYMERYNIVEILYDPVFKKKRMLE